MQHQQRPGLPAIGLALCASLAVAPALAEDVSATFTAPLLYTSEAADYDLLPTAEDFRLDSHTSFHMHHMRRGDPRIKATDSSERIYLGDNLRFLESAAASRSANDKQSGELYLEFGQRGAELVFRF